MTFDKYNLIHFDDEIIEKLDSRTYDHLTPIFRPLGKPCGLWVSDENDFGWHEWASGEKFDLEGLKYAHRVTLKDDAKILIIDTPEGIEEISKNYAAHTAPITFGIDEKTGRVGYGDFGEWIFSINWEAITSKYQGILISPYQRSERLGNNMWYNGWDCASGCIWDLSCIEKFEIIDYLPLYQAEEAVQEALKEALKNVEEHA